MDGRPATEVLGNGDRTGRNVVRHPGYLGNLLVWLGAATALANGVIVALVGIVLRRTYGKRIEAEEGVLLDAFGTDNHERRWTLREFPNRLRHHTRGPG